MCNKIGGERMVPKPRGVALHHATECSLIGPMVPQSSTRTVPYGGSSR